MATEHWGKFEEITTPFPDQRLANSQLEQRVVDILKDRELCRVRSTPAITHTSLPTNSPMIQKSPRAQLCSLPPTGDKILLNQSASIYSSTHLLLMMSYAPLNLKE